MLILVRMFPVTLQLLRCGVEGATARGAEPVTGLCGRGVKTRSHGYPEAPDPVLPPPCGGHGGPVARLLPPCQTRAGRDRSRSQIGLVLGGSRMKAAPDAASRAGPARSIGVAEGAGQDQVAAAGPTTRGGRRLEQEQWRSRRGGCSSVRRPALQCPDQGHLVGVLDRHLPELGGDAGAPATTDSIRSARYIAVASPSRSGRWRGSLPRTARPGAASSVRARKPGDAETLGPMPSIGEMAPWRTVDSP